MRSAVLGMLILVGLGASGCGKLPFLQERPKAADEGGLGATRPEARPTSVTPTPPAGARTVEQFDTTTADERKKAAAAPKPGGETALGETVASLGDPASPGFWLETPLVSAPAKGRVLNPATGKSAQVDLIPIEGPKTAGSRLSLAAMRLIEAPLTDLPVIQVFSGG